MTLIVLGLGAERTAVAAIRLRMRMRILTRPENSLANFMRRGRIWARPPPRGLPRKTAQRHLDDVVGVFPLFLRVRLRLLFFALSLYHVQ